MQLTVRAETTQWIHRQAGARRVNIGEIVDRLVALAEAVKADGGEGALEQAQLPTLGL